MSAAPAWHQRGSRAIGEEGHAPVSKADRAAMRGKATDAEWRELVLIVVRSADGTLGISVNDK